MKPFALLSVTNKTGLEDFARALIERGFEILSTGGTAKYLDEHGVDFTGVSYYTGMPEILDGRVKTLHPKIHGGLLAKPNEKHLQEMDELNIRRIKVLAVNLYPFEEAVLQGANRDEAIENIDIGGPAMIRAAAKNAQHVYVVVDPKDYEKVIADIDHPKREFREMLRAKAFAHTAFYDSLIADYFWDDYQMEIGDTYSIGYRLKQKLRYGENPHQKAGLFISPFEKGGVAQSKQLWGKELSYNNFLDADAAWELASELDALHAGGVFPCVIVKHGNPCGVSWSKIQKQSFLYAKAGDEVSAFGGIVAFTGELQLETAQEIVAKGNFFEVIICSSISDECLEVFKTREGWGQNVRILVAGEPSRQEYLSVRSIRGGALIQSADITDNSNWKVVSEKQPTHDQLLALRNAWIVVKHVKSNAIVIANQDRVLGVGAGQMNRVKSVKLAIEQADDLVKDAVLASDAFFPFSDSILTASEAGISAIVQPGGSKKDDDVISAANEKGLAMLFTGVRHFRH
jgi:phosphoribosylaminoimidazolecarboxamide formyltransferase/IMP cyclohydrolase